MMAGGATGARRRTTAGWPVLCLGLAGILLAGCEDTPAPAPTAAETPAKPVTPPAASGIVLTPQPEGGSGAALVNDPSAPADSPVCGPAAREAASIGQTLLSRQAATAGICSSFTCYDPATATYLGADGYRHVCR